MSKQPTNIIFLLSDQHHPGVLGCQGDSIVRTPHLDRLAASGVSLDNCYCASPLCVPSRMSMLSGLLPTRTGVYCNFQALPSETPTFAHSLGNAGYHTVLCGRMHFVGPDQRHGFDERLIGDVTTAQAGVPNPSYPREFSVATGQSLTAVELSGPGRSTVMAYDEAVIDTATRYLAERDSDEPLFMTIGLYGPHCPFICPRDLYDYYHERLPTPEPAEAFAANAHPAVQRWLTNRGLPATVEAMHRARAAYYGLVELTDRYVGQVAAAVEQHLDPENTLLIYASDHGEMMGEKGMFWKSSFYQGSVGVPIMFSWPGTIPAGKRVTEPTSLLDLGPTLTEWAGGTQLPGADGISLAARITGNAPPPKASDARLIVSLLADVKGDNPAAMVRQGRWKYIEHHGYDSAQLFDLEADPNEEHDLGESAEHAEERKQLAALLAPLWNSEQVSGAVQLAIEQARVMGNWNRAHTVPNHPDVWYGNPDENVLEDRHHGD